MSVKSNIGWQLARAMILILGLSCFHAFFSCAKQKVIDQRTPSGSANLANATSTENMVKGKEIAFTGFPDWCTNQPQDNGSTCIDCERTAGSGEKVAVARMCFEPRINFDPKLLCGLTQIDVGVKTLQCHGIDKDATADVSLPVDRAATVLSVSLASIKNALQDTYKNSDSQLAAATAVAQFAIDNAVKVLTSNDQDKTADELITLANRFLITPYADGSAKDALKAQVVVKLKAVHDAFSGSATFSATKLFSNVLDVARCFPKERLGAAYDVLTPAGIAKLLDAKRSELDPAIANWSGNNVGISSTDDLIKQVKGP